MPLLNAVVQVFADVLPFENITQLLILQMKNDDWHGEFLDAEGEIPDKYVVRIVRIGESSVVNSIETKQNGEVRL